MAPNITLALSAIDIALWDIRGKVFNQPLARLLGGAREKVPTYASGALMRGFPLAHVEKAAARLVETPTAAKMADARATSRGCRYRIIEGPPR